MRKQAAIESIRGRGQPDRLMGVKRKLRFLLPVISYKSRLHDFVRYHQWGWPWPLENDADLKLTDAGMGWGYGAVPTLLG